MVQIDEVSRSNENDNSTSHQANFSIQLNNCDVLDMTAQKQAPQNRVSVYQTQIKRFRPLSRNNEVLDQSSVQDLDLQRQTASSALSKFGELEDTTLGLVYENDN